MEVTRDNFYEILPEVLEEIEECSFVSMDIEISGLWRNGEPRQLDPQDSYYDYFMSSASDFICLQLGLTVFKMNQETRRYKSKTYNFYVFPHQYSKPNDFFFSCQASSLDFLAANNFDFNKVFYKGISYLNIERESELSELLEERRFYKQKNATKKMETIEVPEEHKKCVEETCEKLGSVLKENGDKEVVVPGLNSYIRRLIYQTIKERFPNGEVLVDTREGALVGRKGEVDGHKPKSQSEIDEESLDRAIGFSKVIRAISKSGKLIVGHNMFLDVCHIVHTFLCSLPKTYPEFKEMVKGVFPRLLDTKYMASFEGMNTFISNSTLARLLTRMSEPPFSLPDIEHVKGYSHEGRAEKFHDAGFDSYVTGVCFIAMYNYIGGSKGLVGNVAFNPKSNHIMKYINRIFMNNSPDNHFFLSGPDPEPDRSNFFHINFPKDWVSKDIINLFSPYSRINISWINETSAWVNLCDRSQAQTVRTNLCCSNPKLSKGAVVSPYTSAKYRSVFASRKRQSDITPRRTHPPKRSRLSQSSDQKAAETMSEEGGKGKVKKETILTTPGFESLSSESESVSSSDSYDSVVADLEKDLDLNSEQSGNVFSGSKNWDVS